jgi:hypothetical protein
MVSWVLKVDGPTRFGLGWIATGFDGLESMVQEFSGSLRTGSWPARMGWVSPQGCGSGLDHRELGLVLLGCWVSGSMGPPDARSVHRKSPPVPSAFPASLPARPGSVGFELTGSSGSSGFVGWVTHGHGGTGFPLSSLFRTHSLTRIQLSLHLSVLISHSLLSHCVR